MTGLAVNETAEIDEDVQVLGESAEAIPNNIDWRARGHVHAVKNQRSCGSCWAFAANGAIESHYSIKHGRMVSLSE